MATKRLFWNILAWQLGFALLATAIAVWLAGVAQRAASMHRLEQDLTVAARLLGVRGLLDRTGSNPRQRVSALLSETAGKTELRYTLIEPDGTVFADSSRDPASMENLLQRAEFVQARETGRGRAESSESTGGERLLYVATAVGADASPEGYARVGASLHVVSREVASTRRLVAGFAAIVCGAAILVAAWIARGISRPLRLLTHAARGVSGGESYENLPIAAANEIGELTEAFNTMHRRQVDRIAELETQGRKLEENRELLSTVLGGMIEGVIAVDQRERILFANRTARYMLDLSNADIVGRPIWELVRNQKIVEVTRNALVGRDNVPVELQIPRAQTVVAILASRLPGVPCPGAVLVLHDVTDLRRLERLRHEFVSNVSHELKTPLASIQAYTETLLNGAIEDPAHNRSFLTRIDEQAERLHKLILDLLRLARIESGKDVFEVVAVPLAKAVDVSVEAYDAVARARRITLDVEPPSDNIRVKADADGLQTALDNLIDNAIKYTRDGGRVTVRWAAEGQFARIEVEDTGVGIEAAHLDRIFERFYRVDKARSREMGGTGLGLAIVKHLVQVFDGRITVESQPGVGTKFTLWLHATT